MKGTKRRLTDRQNDRGTKSDDRQTDSKIAAQDQKIVEQFRSTQHKDRRSHDQCNDHNRIVEVFSKIVGQGNTITDQDKYIVQQAQKMQKNDRIVELNYWAYWTNVE